MVGEFKEGNYVKIGGVITKITQSQADQINAGTLAYTAITLTAQWLIDLHFIGYLDDTGVGMYQLYIDIEPQPIYVDFSAKAEVDIYFNDTFLVGNKDYVHQVQNVVKNNLGVMISK